jgi:outer membrane lipoprotein
MRVMRIAGLVIAGVVFVSGCATAVPEAIQKPPPGDAQLGEVRREPATFRGATVRWGGSVVSVRNLKEETEVEVVARRLDNDGRPREEDKTEGRFLARTTGFLDPSVYAAGREVTVRGRIENVIEQQIGDFRYIYPLVRADEVYLWPQRPPPSPPYPYPPPYWWDPWYPWGWPYHRPWYP